MNCEKATEKLFYYMNNELSGEETKALESHLQSCPDCQAALKKEKLFDKTISDQFSPKEVSADFRKDLINVVSHRPKPTKTVWMAMAGSFVLVIIVALISYRAWMNKPLPLYEISVQQHMDYLEGKVDLAVVTEDMKEIIDRYQGKFDFHLERPHVFPGLVKLEGARETQFQREKAAHFTFKKDGHIVSGFYLDLNNVKLPPVDKKNTFESMKSVAYVVKKGKMTSILCYHKMDGTACILVSDMPSDELLRMMG